MKFLVVYSTSFLVFVITFFIAKSLEKHDLLDVAWGLSFVVSAVSSLLIGSHINFITLVATVLVIIWGLRLTFYIAKRNSNKKEDFRYVKYRKEYKGKYFDLYFFFRMYVVQFFLHAIIVFQVVYLNLQGISDFSYIVLLGVAIWIVGFIFESLGDYQLNVFKNNKDNKGKILTTGLWKYTRHPNYFGEALMWWGIYVITISNLENWFLAFSPITITLFVRFVSGVPMLEKKYEGREDWEKYKEKTNVFIPMPPQK